MIHLFALSVAQRQFSHRQDISTMRTPEGDTLKSGQTLASVHLPWISQPQFHTPALPSGNQPSEWSLLHPKGMLFRSAAGPSGVWYVVSRKINSANKKLLVQILSKLISSHNKFRNVQFFSGKKILKTAVKSAFRHLNKRSLISKAPEYLLHCFFCWLFF